MAHLVIQAGDPDERSVDLPEGTTAIGRTQENAVFVLHRSLSRRHAEILILPSGVEIRDLDSKNGTFVNGLRVSRQRLEPGDTIRCGDVPFRFLDGPARKPRAAPSFTPTIVHEIQTEQPRDGMTALLRPQGVSTSALRLRSGEAEGRARDKLQLLLRVSQILSSPEPIDSLLRTIVDLLCEILDVDHAALLLEGGPGGRLETRVARSGKGARATPSPAGDPFYSRQIVEWVRQRGSAALFADAQVDPRLEQNQSIMLQSIRASMCAPLKPKDEVIGVLYVDNRTATGRFSEEDLAFLSAFANQAAFAIENSRLWRRIEGEAVLRESFLRFFPPSTAQKILGSKGVALPTIDAEVTALFADLSNYSELSARMAPRAVVELLNEYFPAMADIVFGNEGTLEKYIGDALLAVWGAPIAHEDDPDRALAAAIAMQRSRERKDGAGPVPLGLHIGLHTGAVAAGNIGSSRYLQYATIGEATNLASRICDAAPDGEIWISEDTRARLHHEPVPIEALPQTPLKGRSDPLPLYRVNWRAG